MIRITLIFVLVISLLTACDSWDDLLESIGGYDSDDTTKTSTDTTTSTSDTSTSDNDTADDDTSDDDTSSDYTNISGTGIVWKPISDHDKKLAVVTPANDPKTDVKIYSTSKKLIETARYTGHYNGNRALYRFDKPGKDYSSPCLLYVKDTYYYIKDSSKRYN